MTGPTMDVMIEPVRELRERFVQMTEPHRPALWRYCRHLTGSAWDAEDLVQDTLLRAFARLANLWQPIANPRAWLFRIASNAWIDGLRRGSVPLDPIESAATVAAPDSSGTEVADALAHLVVMLPPRQRVVVLLVDIFNFTGPEAAAMLGTTDGAIRATLHRARARLARTRESGVAAPRRMSVGTPRAERTLDRFVDAFNRRDAEAIVALLDSDASVDIVGVAEEHGAAVIRAQSLAEAMANPQHQRAEAAVLDGVPVALVFGRPMPDEREALQWIIRLDVTSDVICRWRSYFFTPELLAEAAAALDVPVMAGGYRYAPATGDAG